MTRAQILSSRPILDTITYSGRIAATIGSIFVLMKKNSPSCVLRTGRSDSANAAGVPSASTRTVEMTVAKMEFSIAGPMPCSNTALYWSSVGVKNSFGGLVAASLSCLKDVSTIQNTGKKNPSPTSQATTPHGLNLLVFFFDAAAGAVVSVVLSTMVVMSGRLFLAAEGLEYQPKCEARNDHREDHHHDAHGRGLAHIEAEEGALVDVERQVRTRDARPALRHHVDGVERVDQIDRAEHDAQLDEAPKVGQRQLPEELDRARTVDS